MVKRYCCFRLDLGKSMTGDLNFVMYYFHLFISFMFIRKVKDGSGEYQYIAIWEGQF